MIRLRPYKSQDAEYILQWVRNEEEFAKWCANKIMYPFTEKSMEALKADFDKDDRGWLFTAMDPGGTPIGFFGMTKADYERESIHLCFIIIDSSKRSQGYGGQMMDQIIKYAFQVLMVSRITLKVFDHNEAAHACYQKAGFIDEMYNETAFSFKEDVWGCYDMAIYKNIQG